LKYKSPPRRDIGRCHFGEKIFIRTEKIGKTLKKRKKKEERQGCIYWKILLTGGGGVGISADVIREKKYKKGEEKKTIN
jgi:hypothetical protein